MVTTMHFSYRKCNAPVNVLSAKLGAHGRQILLTKLTEEQTSIIHISPRLAVQLLLKLKSQGFIAAHILCEIRHTYTSWMCHENINNVEIIHVLYHTCVLDLYSIVSRLCSYGLLSVCMQESLWTDSLKLLHPSDHYILHPCRFWYSKGGLGNIIWVALDFSLYILRLLSPLWGVFTRRRLTFIPGCWFLLVFRSSSSFSSNSFQETRAEVGEVQI